MDNSGISPEQHLSGATSNEQVGDQKVENGVAEVSKEEEPRGEEEEEEEAEHPISPEFQ